VPYTGGVVPYTCGVVPYTGGVVPYTGGVVPCTGRVVPYTGGVVPYTENTRPDQYQPRAAACLRSSPMYASFQSPMIKSVANDPRAAKFREA